MGLNKRHPISSYCTCSWIQLILLRQDTLNTRSTRGERRPPPSGAVAGACAKLLLSETLTTERESLKGGGGG